MFLCQPAVLQVSSQIEEAKLWLLSRQGEVHAQREQAAHARSVVGNKKVCQILKQLELSLQHATVDLMKLDAAGETASTQAVASAQAEQTQHKPQLEITQQQQPSAELSELPGSQAEEEVSVLRSKLAKQQQVLSQTEQNLAKVSSALQTSLAEHRAALSKAQRAELQAAGDRTVRLALQTKLQEAELQLTASDGSHAELQMKLQEAELQLAVSEGSHAKLRAKLQEAEVQLSARQSSHASEDDLSLQLAIAQYEILNKAEWAEKKQMATKVTYQLASGNAQCCGCLQKAKA